MIKQKSDNERMEQSSLNLKSPQYYRTDEKRSARDGWYKIVVAEFGKLSKLIRVVFLSGKYKKVHGKQRAN